MSLFCRFLSKLLRMNAIVPGRWVFKTGSKGAVIDLLSFNILVAEDHNTKWLSVDSLVDVNSSGEVIARGTTIYGESHAMLLRPVR